MSRGQNLNGFRKASSDQISKSVKTIVAIELEKVDEIMDSHDLFLYITDSQGGEEAPYWIKGKRNTVLFTVEHHLKLKSLQSLFSSTGYNSSLEEHRSGR